MFLEKCMTRVRGKKIADLDFKGTPLHASLARHFYTAVFFYIYFTVKPYKKQVKAMI